MAELGSSPGAGGLREQFLLNQLAGLDDSLASYLLAQLNINKRGEREEKVATRRAKADRAVSNVMAGGTEKKAENDNELQSEGKNSIVSGEAEGMLPVAGKVQVESVAAPVVMGGSGVPRQDEMSKAMPVVPDTAASLDQGSNCEIAASPAGAKAELLSATTEVTDRANETYNEDPLGRKIIAGPEDQSLPCAGVQQHSTADQAFQAADMQHSLAGPPGSRVVKAADDLPVIKKKAEVSQLAANGDQVLSEKTPVCKDICHQLSDTVTSATAGPDVDAGGWATDSFDNSSKLAAICSAAEILTENIKSHQHNAPLANESRQDCVAVVPAKQRIAALHDRQPEDPSCGQAASSGRAFSARKKVDDYSDDDDYSAYESDSDGRFSPENYTKKRIKHLTRSI
jgi:hypothetical protein